MFANDFDAFLRICICVYSVQRVCVNDVDALWVENLSELSYNSFHGMMECAAIYFFPLQNVVHVPTFCF